MWERIYSKRCDDISREKIWKIWTDVNNWPRWHDDLEYCKLEGKFAVGSRFTLKPKNAPPVKIEIIDIQGKDQFTDCTKLFGAKMYDTHIIQETEKGLLLTNRLLVTGPLKYFWILLVARHIARTVPEEMEALVRLAQKE